MTDNKTVLTYMKKYISALCVKFISLLLAFTLVFECNAPAFAAVTTGSDFALGGGLSPFKADEKALNDFDEKFAALVQAGQEGNPYEASLNAEIKSNLKYLNDSSDRKKLASLKQEGKSKYGVMWPAYVKKSGATSAAALENNLIKFLSDYFAKFEVMPYERFSKVYEAAVKESAKSYVAQFWTKDKVYAPFKTPQDAAEAAIRQKTPLKEAYRLYVKEAKAELAWRQANEKKIEQGGYKVIRAYIDALGIEVLSAPVLNALLNLELDGKKVVTPQEVKSLKEYTLARLEKQNLNPLNTGVLTSETNKKIAAHLLKDLIETIVTGGYVNTNDPAYGKAVESIIYRSENTAAFNHLLSAGFASLLAAKDYNALRRILSRYNAQEKKGSSFGDYISLSFYADKLHNFKGNYLGKASEAGQYTTKYAYKNTFTEMAELLAEDGSREALAILKEYGTDKGLDGIRPFLYGALLSGKSGADRQKAEAFAEKLVNLSMGDITATQEYDIDSTLLKKYPAINSKLGKGAVTDSKKLKDRKSANEKFAYLHRAALAGDILILVWGAVAIVKIGGKAMALGRSAYTAVKAGRITNTAKRVAYIRANYAKMSRYVSARNSIQAMKLHWQTLELKAVGSVKGVEAVKTSRVAVKVQNRANNAELAKLRDIRQKVVEDLNATANPTERQLARFDVANSQYNAKKAQIDFLKKVRSYGSSAEAKNAAYSAEIAAYNANVARYNALLSSLKGADPAKAAEIETELTNLKAILDASVPQAPVYSAGELGYFKSAGKFRSALADFNQSRNIYKQTGFWHTYIKKPWLSAPEGDGTLGIWKLETAEGTTLADALNIKRPYNPDLANGVKLFSGGAAENGNVTRFYNFLSRNHLKPLASTLKFINNKATLFGFSLLFNYNIATITPEALNAGRAAAVTTELVADAAEAFDGIELFGMLARSMPASPLASGLKPVNLIDPKILQFYKGVPLPGGNIVSDFTPKALMGTMGNLTALSGVSLAMPLMLGRDLAGSFSTAFLKTPQLKAPSANFTLPMPDAVAQTNNAGAWQLFNGSVSAAPKYVYEMPATPKFTGGIAQEQNQNKPTNLQPFTTMYGIHRAQVRQKKAEEQALAAAWDQVDNDWRGGANAVMAEMEFEGISFEVRHGYAIQDEETGDLIVQGPVLRQKTGNFSNFGLTKVIYKHSARGGLMLQYAGSKYVTKEDFTSLPYIIRNYEPEILDKGKTLRYVIQDPGGQVLIVVFKAKSKRVYSLITMYYKKDVPAGLKISPALKDGLAKKLGLKPRFKQTQEVVAVNDAAQAVEKKVRPAMQTDLKDRAFTMSVIYEDGTEKMLPATLSFNENFQTRGYSNVVFNKGVAELRQYGKEPRVMSNFFIVLKNKNKSFKHFIDALKTSGQNITVKFFQYGIKPRKTITTTLYNADGTEPLPVKVITDPNFLKDGSKLVFTPSGRIGVLAAKGYMPDLIDDTAVLRIPKNQTETFLKLMFLTQKPLPIEIMPNFNKANVIIEEGFYINPSLGKTLGPVLPQSLGVSEEFATNLMYLVNYMPGLLSPLLNPLINRFGEVAIFKFSILMSSIAAMLPVFFGFYGYSSQIEPTVIRSVSLGIALFALAFSINVRNVVGNTIINMNRGAMPIAKDKKKEEKTVTEAARITGQMLWEKVKKVFAPATDFSMEDILFYNRSFINKNLGTMAFLIAPSVLNYGGQVFGADLNLGWDVALPLYAAYSGYAGWRVHNTNLRDRKIIEGIKTNVYQIESQETVAGVAENKKGFGQSVREIWDTAIHREGVLGICAGMTLATVHELSVSSAFSSTLYQIIPDGDMATIMVIGILYGSLMAGRLLGNITTTRMSAGTSYLGYSALSLGGTAVIAAGIMADMPWMVLTGGVIASIGIGNYFSQMFAYIIRKHPELQSQISQVLSFTMPIAVGLSMPITYVNDWFGVPYARVMASFAMLVGSLITTKGMMESSTLYKYIVQEFKEAHDYVVNKFKKTPQTEETGSAPVDMNNPEPQN